MKKIRTNGTSRTHHPLRRSPQLIRARHTPAQLLEEVRALRLRVRELESSVEPIRAAAAPVDQHGKAGAPDQGPRAHFAEIGTELRTALNTIVGMTELMFETDLTVQQRGYLRTVKSSADAVISLVGSILDFSSLEAGEVAVDPIEFNLRDSLGYTMGALALRGNEKSVQVVCHVLPEVPDIVVGDPWILRQAISTLVDSAIRGMEHGVVILRVENDWETVRDAQLHFTVTATALRPASAGGRAAMTAGSPVLDQLAGLHRGGLGLTMATRLVELMGGEVWVKPQAGEGLVCHFTASFGLQQHATIRLAPIRIERLEGLPVLVVDPHATNRRLLHELLTKWRMKPVEADSSTAALNALSWASRAGTAFALVLLDVELPEMSGFALAEQMLQRPEASHAKLMMLTSLGHRGDAARCKQLGIAAYLTRPIKPSDLLDAITTVLGMSAGTAHPLLVTRHSLRESQRMLSVLFVERNPLNQHFAVRVLEKRGHTVVVADTGSAAVAAVAQQSFDVILLSFQFSEQERADVTAAVRQRSLATKTSPRLVVMTTHPTEEERQRCLASGIAGYLSSPFHAKTLLELFDRFLHAPVGGDESSPSPSAGDRLLDGAELLTRVDGDLKLLSELIELFLAEESQRLMAIKAAIAQRDGQTLASAAHALHASLETLSAGAACELTWKLETIGRTSAWPETATVCAALEEELERLKRSFDVLRMERAAAGPA